MIELEFNYEYNNRIYKIKAEKAKDAYVITYDGTTYTVHATEIKPGHLRIQIGDTVIKAVISEGNESKFIFINGDVFNIKRAILKHKRADREDELLSPISGRVVKVEVKEGDKIRKGDIIMVIEAMKMEYLIKAPYDGVIKKIYFKENDQIDMGVKPVEIEKEE